MIRKWEDNENQIRRAKNVQRLKMYYVQRKRLKRYEYERRIINRYYIQRRKMKFTTTKNKAAKIDIIYREER